jgi:branched-chain amino acid aminotransferase
MLEERKVYVNGEYKDFNDATVHVMSHSFARGSCIFEVLSFHATGKGPVIFRLQDHITRLFNSAKLLDMELPLSRTEFYDAVVQTIQRNELSQGMIKIVGFYPQIVFDIMPPREPLAISIIAVDPARDVENLAAPMEGGTSACISRWRKMDPQTVPIEAKAAANYLNGMVARIEAQKRGFDDTVMLDTQGFIAEGGTESIFLVTDGRLTTPALGTVLQSITRKSVLEAAEFLGIETIEERLPPELIFEADEVFFSCTPFKVLPVRKFEDRQFDNVPGPLTRKLSALMQRIVAGEEEHFNDWLFPVEPK